MPHPADNVSEQLLGAGHAADVAVIDRTGQHTYAELRAATQVLTQHLANWSLPAGSRVGLLSRNSLFWVASYLAILRAGHVAVPFATVLTAEDVDHKAAFVGCEAFLFDTGLARTFGPLMETATHVADESAMVAPVVPNGAGELGAVAVDPDDDAVLMFTSGTTSAPRAVRVSHRNIRANTDSIVSYLNLTPDDRMLVVLPLSYCYGASLLHTHLSVGASVAICDTFAFPETVIEQIQRDRCTGIAGVPSTYQLLLRASTFESTPLPTLQIMQQAGGRLPQPQMDRVAAAQPQAQLFVQYGATEATARLSYLPPDLLHERRGSIGRGIPGVELTVVDPDGRPVPPGVVGEVFARGDNITQGYWNDPAGSAAKFVDGGLRTGDLARADDDGYLTIVDRQADFIKSWGIRVSSHEIEDAVVALPGVASAAAVGRPDEDAGESIVLFYAAAPDSDVTQEEVLTHCRATLAKHLVPHEVRRLPDLPLNQNGKVLKSELKVLATT
ncbi:AMP-binding protein [Ornithinimicrobium ciconiae]|uniref:AMP-binding protein n=1 Tax=Ornithinimicrobium ciconiae TaxID=2594265 RepID=A0A516G7G8_9MICO|nr:AMP-binding protein [Ornithinimicrobium ciconiae]QDO87432.1 AMP-binding protein [Ornithinimicrobium ciconiae]